jgi:hypothetical protein
LALSLAFTTAACHSWPGDRHLSAELAQKPEMVRRESTGVVLVENSLGVEPHFLPEAPSLSEVRITRCPVRVPPPFARAIATWLPADACMAHLDPVATHLGNLPFVQVYAAPGATVDDLAAYLRSKEHAVAKAANYEVREKPSGKPGHLTFVLRGPQGGCMMDESAIHYALVKRPLGGTFLVVSVGGALPSLTVAPSLQSVERRKTLRRWAAQPGIAADEHLGRFAPSVGRR